MTGRLDHTRPIFLVVMMLIVGACDTGGGMTSPSTSVPSRASWLTSSTTPASEIDYLGYVDAVLEILESRHWRSSEIEWQALRAEVRGSLPELPTQSQAYQAIELALDVIGDRHTRFRPPWEDVPIDASGPRPRGDRLEGDIGYLYVPGNHLLSDDAFTMYASYIVEAMREVDQSSPVCGWIIDLRDNIGGSIPPMLLGLGPLFGDGVFLSYVGTRGRTMEWEYRKGSLLVNGIPFDEMTVHESEAPYDSPYVLPSPVTLRLQAAFRLYTNAYTPDDPEAPVALLISDLTASAAEGVLVGFLGRPDTRSFGVPTAGLPTGVEGVHMLDGAVLAVAGSRSRDRLGRLYEDRIKPMRRSVDLFPFDQEDAVQGEAAGWLATTEHCARN